MTRNCAATKRNIFGKNYVKRLFDDHVRGQQQHRTRLGALLMLELWFRMWVDRPAEAALVLSVTQDCRVNRVLGSMASHTVRSFRQSFDQGQSGA